MDMSAPTPTKDTMRSMEPMRDKSTRNNLPTTTVRSAAPASHIILLGLRAPTSIADKASTAQNMDSAVCTRVDAAKASMENGTPPH